MNKIQEILELDCRNKNNKITLLHTLYKIKPLRKYLGQDVPLSEMEKVIKKISNKYGIKLVSIIPEVNANKELIVWGSTIRVGSLFGRKPYKNIYGCSLYEVMCKTVIYFYDYMIRIRKKGNE